MASGHKEHQRGPTEDAESLKPARDANCRRWPLDRSGVREAAPLCAFAVAVTSPFARNIVPSS
jgi:hypothetical protein